MFEVKSDILKKVLEHFADEQYLISEKVNWTFSEFLKTQFVIFQSFLLELQSSR